MTFSLEKYFNKKILITGHTGFKGAWLTQWLLIHGAKIFGISDRIPTQPSLFKILELENHVNHILLDIRDRDRLIDTIINIAPDFIFHLAAQPIVSTSFKNPVETITVNTLGTVNILEALLKINKKCTCILVSSDKCYYNEEWIWGYREIDKLGGKDIYSASKAAGEIFIHAYFKSFIEKQTHLKVASVRSGNVIGGGDWAADRLIPDIMKAWTKGEKVEIRNPNSTRPWQHVLEPLSGYLQLALALEENEKLSGEGFNFGPDKENNASVYEMVCRLGSLWKIDPEKMYYLNEDKGFPESKLLNLNCDKVYSFLKWRSVMDLNLTINFTSDWYFNFYKGKRNMIVLTKNQIFEYEKLRKELNQMATFS